MSAGSRQAPPMPMVITVSGNRSRIRARQPALRRPASSAPRCGPPLSGTATTTSSSRTEVIAPSIRVVKKWSMAAPTRFPRAPVLSARVLLDRVPPARAEPAASKATARIRCSRVGS
jgi:hypothetical protein